MMNQVERSDRPPSGHPGVWNPPIPASSSGGRGPVQRIMFASQKGGVAKTASAVNVAVALGQKGLRTLLVDTDPIGSVAACFGTTVPPGHPGIYGVDNWDVADLAIPGITENLDMMPISIPLDREVGEGLLVDRPIVIYNPNSPVSRAYRQIAELLVTNAMSKPR